MCLLLAEQSFHFCLVQVPGENLIWYSLYIIRIAIDGVLLGHMATVSQSVVFQGHVVQNMATYAEGTT